MPRRVLVVDDEADITCALKVGLEGKGFNVHAYNDPTVALSNFKPEMFDIAILDMRMPKMSGFDLYREMMKVDGRPRSCSSPPSMSTARSLRRCSPTSRSRLS